MKNAVISYSFSWNNDLLAQKITKQLWATHIKIEECKKRTIFAIILDIIFKRKPKINNKLEELDLNWNIIFIWPVWMWQVATPFRKCFDYLKDNIWSYYYASISGWAVWWNPKLEEELEQKLWKPPKKIINLFISDLIKKEDGEAPTMQETWKYKLTSEDLENISRKVLLELKNF